MADHAHAHAHDADHSADTEYAFTPEGSTYEHTDAHVWIIVKFMFWLAVSAIIIHVGIGFMYEAMIQRSMEVGEQRYPLAVDAANRLPPTPRLQQFPANDIYQFRLSEQALLNDYGWMNREAGVAHIPIAEAMRLTVERGLPVRAQDAAADPAAAAAPAGDVIELRPSDSSAGRQMERRR
jgi:hypothetical protein